LNLYSYTVYYLYTSLAVWVYFIYSRWTAWCKR